MDPKAGDIMAREQGEVGRVTVGVERTHAKSNSKL